MPPQTRTNRRRTGILRTCLHFHDVGYGRCGFSTFTAFSTRARWGARCVGWECVSAHSLAISLLPVWILGANSGKISAVPPACRAWNHSDLLVGRADLCHLPSASCSDWRQQAPLDYDAVRGLSRLEHCLPPPFHTSYSSIACKQTRTGGGNNRYTVPGLECRCYQVRTYLGTVAVTGIRYLIVVPFLEHEHRNAWAGVEPLRAFLNRFPWNRPVAFSNLLNDLLGLLTSTLCRLANAGISAQCQTRGGYEQASHLPVPTFLPRTLRFAAALRCSTFSALIIRTRLGALCRDGHTATCLATDPAMHIVS